MKMIQLFILSTYIGLFLTLQSCQSQTLSNKTDRTIMECGNEFDISPNQVLLTSNLIDLIGIEKATQSSVQLWGDESQSTSAIKVSKKGCILVPRSTSSVDSLLFIKDPPLKAEISKDDLVEKSIRFRKDETKPSVSIKSAKRQFNSLDKIPITEAQGLMLKYCWNNLSDTQNVCSSNSDQDLWSSTNYIIFSTTVDDLPKASGNFRLYILSKDMFDRSNLFSFDIQIDNREPNIIPNFAEPFRAVKFNQRNSFLVDVDFTLAFSSNKPLKDLSIIYCLQPLTQALEDPKSECEIPTLFDPFSSVNFKPGFWQFSYQVEDNAGNKSQWKSQNLVVGESCQFESIQELITTHFCTTITGVIIANNSTSIISDQIWRNLIHVEGRLEFNRINISGEILSNLRTVGSLSIIQSSMKSLEAFSNLEKVRDSIKIIDNTQLLDLRGLDKLQSLSSDFIIDSNSNLQSLAGLEGMKSIGDSLTLSNNNKLRDITATNGIRYLGSLNISKSPNLMTLGEWPRLLQLQTLKLTELPELKELTSFPHLKKLSKMNLVKLDKILNVSGFPELQSIQSDIFIDSNSALEDLNGLSSVALSFSTLQITKNLNLTTLFQAPSKQASWWPDIQAVIVTDNPKLCVNLKDFFQEDERHLESYFSRLIQRNCGSSK